MKIKFQGWQREIVEHNHEVIPVAHELNKIRVIEGAKDIKWLGGLRATGKLTDLKLSGAFLVKFDFSTQELENWLLTYAQTFPEEALRLISKAHSEALIELVNRTKS